MSDQKIDPSKGFNPTPDTMYANSAGREITKRFQEIIGEYNMQEIIARHAKPVLDAKDAIFNGALITMGNMQDELTNAREARDLLLEQVAAQADEIARLKEEVKLWGPDARIRGVWPKEDTTDE